MGALGTIPEAWPLLLTKEQACAYLGGMCEGTFDKIVPVAPVDLGVRKLVWRRPDLDGWAMSLPARLPRGAESAQSVEPAPPVPAGPPVAGDDERRSASVERARARARSKAA